MNVKFTKVKNKQGVEPVVVFADGETAHLLLTEELRAEAITVRHRVKVRATRGPQVGGGGSSPLQRTPACGGPNRIH